MTPIAITLLLINLIALAQMGIDKQCAKKGRRRIPEAQLIAPVLLGGVVGLLLGMILFRHKTKKLSFQIKLLLTFFVFCGLLYLI